MCGTKRIRDSLAGLLLQALMLRRRLPVVVLLAALAAVGARVAAPSAQGHLRVSAASRCGVERWTVKTLQDRPKLFATRRSSVAHLASIPRPASVPATRLPFERHVYSVVAAVTLVRPEADGDLHVVLHGGGRQMIAEAPSSSCTSNARPARRSQTADARGAVHVCSRARVVGVAFWDELHGQTGVAPNGIELHPILSFACLGGGVPPPPPPPSGACAPSYPTVCIPPPPPDLDCGDISYRRFVVRWNVANPDPHHFDGDRDGIGCES